MAAANIFCTQCGHEDNYDDLNARMLRGEAPKHQCPNCGDSEHNPENIEYKASPLVRCVICREEFDYRELDKLAAKACPSCGDHGVPMFVSEDLTVAINWHELRILVMWAEQWAAHVEKEEPRDDTIDSVELVQRIAQRIEAQHIDIAERKPLTRSAEIERMKDSIVAMFSNMGFKVVGSESDLDGGAVALELPGDEETSSAGDVA